METKDLPLEGFVPFVLPVLSGEHAREEACSRDILPEGFLEMGMTASLLGQGAHTELSFPEDEDFLDGIPPWAGRF